MEQKQRVILHTATRVIRGLTINPDTIPNSDETIIEVDTPLVLDGFQKLDIDNKTLLTPTQDEIDASGVDESRNMYLHQLKVNKNREAIDDILANATNENLLDKIKVYFQTLKDIQ